MDASFRIEPAAERDVPLILRFIKDLADYEAPAREVEATEASLRESLFGASPAAEVVIAYVGDRTVSASRSSSRASPRSSAARDCISRISSFPRNGGATASGGRLLAHLARLAVERGYGRMEWSVLDWNELALGVYRRIGARADGRMDRPSADRRRASEAGGQLGRL